MSKTGLILEGGGLRGIFTGGVIDCFIDSDIDVDYVIGVSAGSCNGYAYLAKQRGYIKKCLIQKNPFESFYGVPQMFESHRFLDLDKLFYDYAEKYDFAYDKVVNSPTPWEAVVTNIETGKAEYMTTKEIERAQLIGRASCSMPALAPAVDIDGQLYLDGGISDSIPVEHALAQGCDQLIIVLTRKRGNYSAFSERNMRMFSRIYSDYPHFLQALSERGEMYKSEVALAEELEAQGKAIVIRPTLQEVGRLESDEDALSLSYYHGYTKAEEYIDQIRKWLN